MESTNQSTVMTREPYIGSALHKERERARLKRWYANPDNKAQKLKYLREKREEDKDIKYRCELCDRSVCLISKSAHLKTKLHQSKVKDTPNKNPY